MTHRILAILATIGVLLAPGTASAAQEMTMWKSPWCGCCDSWANGMRKAGYRIAVENREEMSPVKKQVGVPVAMEACHTAVIDGYFVEGHVPAEAVARLMSERPDIAGIAVPGMPAGSMGMGDDPNARYNVMSVDRSGGVALYRQVGGR
ncbi:DUF411 domain-containing protein [Stappia sp. ES.058]|uniref:DUF411 domain-containing protein n=1 Tax=Stappia sp. ES.058 TaxID=1881061 RepID=UPI00087D3E2A|nr:DUF411 domain-containing protein [Stappia sp. ES.058]SDU29353.1 Uncharacterized conserved protein [Stappia sp. ES.058]